MPKNTVNRRIFKRLWKHISPRRKKQFYALFVLVILTSLTEGLSIGALFPFLALLTNPEVIYKLDFIKPILGLIAFDNSPPPSPLFLATAAFCLAACVSAIARILLLWASAKLSFNTGADLGIDLYRKALHQSYAQHISVNSSEVIHLITAKSNDLTGTLMSVMTILASTVMLITISLTLVYINPWVALASFVSFGSLYGMIILVTRRRLINNSLRIAQNATAVVKSLQEGLGGIRDVLLAGTQSVYCEIYRKVDVPLRQAQAENNFIGASPRYAMEGLGMILIALFAYTLAQNSSSLPTALPVIGALVMGAQRLLPLLQNIYSSASNLSGAQASVEEALNLLESPLPQYVTNKQCVIPKNFKDTISLRNVSFKYAKDSPFILKDITLEIKKGTRIGFIGTTGSGKSTLMDIIMGLLEPTEGSLEIDGVPIDYGDPRGWQTRISHVPQAIYLTDSTIAENIALGVESKEIDLDMVIKAASLAQIADTIERLPLKYQTIVGERGVRLSGGQRQRIGIARALYRKADVIIFDEATSSLDRDTEQAVITALESLSSDLTILIIAHRETTIAGCTTVFRIEEGKLISTQGIDS
jgi:ABC-type multidrug transport system fused ATPase/permease subunit